MANANLFCLQFWRLAKPHENSRSLFVDLPHPHDLNAFFIVRTLVDTNCIDPDVLIDKLGLEDLAQGIVQILANPKLMLIHRDLGDVSLWAPLVRESSIAGLGMGGGVDDLENWCWF